MHRMLSASVIRRDILRRTAIYAAHLSSVKIPRDDAAFADLLTAQGKKIIYFTASWCPPCKRIAPIFEKLSNSAENSSITFVKADVDQLLDAAAAAGIQSVPTFQFLNGNTKLFEFCGADEEMLKRNIMQLLGR